MRADLVRPTDDRLDVLDLPRLVEDVADRDEQRALVDPLDDLLVRLADDDLEVRLRLVEVADGREVAALVDDAVASGIDRTEARERDRLGDGHVLVHHRRSRGGADDTADLVADRPRRSHQPSAQARIPRSSHMRPNSARRSAALRGIGPSEWLTR